MTSEDSPPFSSGRTNAEERKVVCQIKIIKQISKTVDKDSQTDIQELIILCPILLCIIILTILCPTWISVYQFYLPGKTRLHLYYAYNVFCPFLFSAANCILYWQSNSSKHTSLSSVQKASHTTLCGWKHSSFFLFFFSSVYSTVRSVLQHASGISFNYIQTPPHTCYFKISAIILERRRVQKLLMADVELIPTDSLLR